MDMEKNVIPDTVETIHITGVCGTAMGALACMLKEAGYRVTGSDQKVYPPMSLFLEEKGIDIQAGFSSDNLDYGPDLVIIGNVVRRENPEAVAVFEKGIPFCSLPQALNHFFADGKKAIVVTGTHGKTTTSSLIAWVLYHAGLDPTFMIGGILKNFDSNYRIGQGDYIVIEGDEYDTAFFDKGPKFNHFNPDITILTSIEFDHADIFRDLDHVRETFASFIRKQSAGSLLIAVDNDKNIDRVISERGSGLLRYGLSETADWRCREFHVGNGRTEFRVDKNREDYGRVVSGMPGEHNAMNTLAVMAAADAAGIPSGRLLEGIKTFKGIKRRQEVRGVKNGVRVIDDFAHHPTAVTETINAVKRFYSEGRLIAVFEPRTNSSRRNVFQEAYTGSFESADVVLICEPFGIDMIPKEERFSSEKLVDELKRRNQKATLFDSTDAIVEWVHLEAAKGDTILVMSNGGFDNIHEKLLEVL